MMFLIDLGILMDFGRIWRRLRSSESRPRTSRQLMSVGLGARDTFSLYLQGLSALTGHYILII